MIKNSLLFLIFEYISFIGLDISLCHREPMICSYFEFKKQINNV